MQDHDLEKLLSGFAADTLQPEDRALLCRAASQDQQLFKALADKQALKELLADPAVRLKLLEMSKQFDTSKANGSSSRWAWFKRPAGLAFAGGLATAACAIAFGIRSYQESLDRAAQSVVSEAPNPATPSANIPQPSIPAQLPAVEPTVQKETNGQPATALAKQEALTGQMAKRERSVPAMREEKATSNAARDSAMSQRERDESRGQAQSPMAAIGNTAGQEQASTGQKFAATAAPPAPAPMQAMGSIAAASTAQKKSARALFYGEESTRANADRSAEGAAAQLKPLGLRYSFVTRGTDGQSQEVTAAAAARSREPVRITVETSQDAFLQILQTLGSAGTRLWWPPQESGKISLKVLAGKRSEIPLPPPAESGLLALIIRLSPKPFAPLTMQEVGMLDRFSANLLIETVSPDRVSGIQEQATYIVNPDSSSTAQLAVAVPVSK